MYTQVHMIIFNKSTPETQVNMKKSERNSYLFLIQEIRLKFLNGIWVFYLFCFVLQKEKICSLYSQEEETLYAKCQHGAHFYSQPLNP